MISSIHLDKEISVTIVNKIGILADISEIIANHGINIEAVGGIAIENKAMLMLLTNDSRRALDALVAKGYKSAKENEVAVVELENKPGALKNVAKKLAQEGIDIKYIYGSACSGACPSKIVLSTNDNAKALVVLKK